MNRTPDGIEAEARIVRLQLLGAGACIRERARPARLVDAVKRATSQKTREFGKQFADRSGAAGWVLLGGSIGSLLMMMARPSRPAEPGTPLVADEIEAALRTPPKPTLAAELKAASLSALGIGLGYVAASTVPRTTVEDELIGPVREVVRRETSKFIDLHAEGMKQSAANLFGLSRIAAGALAALAIVAEQSRPKSS